jgi:hypothetical protein
MRSSSSSHRRVVVNKKPNFQSDVRAMNDKVEKMARENLTTDQKVLIFSQEILKVLSKHHPKYKN